MNAHLARMDAYTLAYEVSRHAAVAARHLSYAQQADAIDDQASADRWVHSAGLLEDDFLAEVTEARRRLAENDPDLPSYLELFGAADLVAVPATT